MRIAWAVSILVVLRAGVDGRADVGVFTGTGQNLRQISTEKVQLVSIDVTITPRRGPFLFDGTVRRLDRADYSCKFILRNLTDKACTLQVGFPIDSQFAERAEDGAADSLAWVSEYGFIARDQHTTYHVDFQWRSVRPASPTAAKAIFAWQMHFSPSETKTLVVLYNLPISETLAMSSKRGLDPDPPSPGNEWLRSTGGCLMEFFGYTTETGSTWAGNVKEASFTIITQPFEQYLDRRGWTEVLPPGELDPEAAELRTRLWLKRCWWYRDVVPDGWRPVSGGIRWSHKDFKPKDELMVRYYLTQFPVQASDVGPWIRVIRRIGRDENSSISSKQLSRQLRELLLATYGKEPTDAEVKAFAEDQIWYRHKKDFSLDALTSEQRAILAEVDRFAQEGATRGTP